MCSMCLEFHLGCCFLSNDVPWHQGKLLRRGGWKPPVRLTNQAAACECPVTEEEAKK